MILYQPKRRKSKEITTQVKQLADFFRKYNLKDIKKETSLEEFYEKYAQNNRKCISWLLW